MNINNLKNFLKESLLSIVIFFFLLFSSFYYFKTQMENNINNFLINTETLKDYVSSLADVIEREKGDFFCNFKTNDFLTIVMMM